jgi:hypothetical protein
LLIAALKLIPRKVIDKCKLKAIRDDQTQWEDLKELHRGKAPDLDMIQRVGGFALGNERLGKLLAFNLRRTVEAMHHKQA